MYLISSFLNYLIFNSFSYSLVSSLYIIQFNIGFDITFGIKGGISYFFNNYFQLMSFIQACYFNYFMPLDEPKSYFRFFRRSLFIKFANKWDKFLVIINQLFKFVVKELFILFIFYFSIYGLLLSIRLQPITLIRINRKFNHSILSIILREPCIQESHLNRISQFSTILQSQDQST